MLKKLALAVTAAIALPLLFTGVAWGHGYTITPQSRAYKCAQKTVSDCGAIQYEPQSTEGPKNFPAGGPADGKLCSAGVTRFAELDNQRGGAWPTTKLTSGASYKFSWHLTAAHATTGFRYFVTKNGWKPSDALTRAQLDLTPFLNVPFNGQRPGADVSHSGNLPSGKSGRHMILAVWDIADTANAFYQCSDVTF